jgi:hypothetical protein
MIHQFWTMGAPLAATIIINRAVKTRAPFGHDHRRPLAR